jgi:hypothetical protein
MGASAARDGPLLKPPARSTKLVSSAGSAGRADPWTVDRARRKPSGPEVFAPGKQLRRELRHCGRTDSLGQLKDALRSRSPTSTDRGDSMTSAQMVRRAEVVKPTGIRAEHDQLRILRTDLTNAANRHEQLPPHHIVRPRVADGDPSRHDRPANKTSPPKSAERLTATARLPRSLAGDELDRFPRFQRMPVQRERHHPFTDSQFARHAQSLRRTLVPESRGANSIAFAR